LSNCSNSQPKSQPKSAVPTKNNGAGSGARGKGGRGAKKTRNPRPAKKTAEELDSEMADYWETGATNGGDATATIGAAQPANGDANMDEEILVSRVVYQTWEFTDHHVVNFFKSSSG
jgi:THO complex subunit 4